MIRQGETVRRITELRVRNDGKEKTKTKTTRPGETDPRLGAPRVKRSPGKCTSNLFFLALVIITARCALIFLRSRSINAKISIDGNLRDASVRFYEPTLRVARFICNSANVNAQEISSSSCDERLGGILAALRKVQFEYLFQKNDIFLLIIGWSCSMQMHTHLGSYPLVWSPAETKSHALRRWGDSFGMFLSDEAIAKIDASKKKLFADMQLRTSASLEALAVIALTAFLAALVDWLAGNNFSHERHRGSTLDMILSRRAANISRLLLAIVVVFGHSLQLLNLNDPIVSSGIETSALACSVLFFFSGIGVTGALLNSEISPLEQLTARLVRHWCWAGVLFIFASGYSILWHEKWPDDALMFEVCLSMWVEWSPVPTATVLENWAPSLWTIRISVLCWVTVSLLAHAGSLKPVTLLAVLSACLTMNTNFYYTAFFVGCFLVSAEYEGWINIDHLLHWPFAFIMMPWSQMILGYQTSPRTVALICCFVVLTFQRRISVVDNIANSTIVSIARAIEHKISIYLIGMFYFGSAIQIILIKDYFFSDPIMLSLSSIALSFCLCEFV